MLKNCKDDLGKVDSKSAGGVLVGYSSSSKAYRVFNKRTLCIEKSVHVVFDESADLRNRDMKDDDDLLELLKL